MAKMNRLVLAASLLMLSAASAHAVPLRTNSFSAWVQDLQQEAYKRRLIT